MNLIELQENSRTTEISTSNEYIKIIIRNKKNILNIDEIKYLSLDEISIDEKKKPSLYTPQELMKLPKSQFYNVASEESKSDYTVIDKERLKCSYKHLLLKGLKVKSSFIKTLLNVSIWEIEGIEQFDENDECLLIDNSYYTFNKVLSIINKLFLCQDAIFDFDYKNTPEKRLYFINLDAYKIKNLNKVVKFSDILEKVMSEGLEFDDDKYIIANNTLNSKNCTDEDVLIQLSYLRNCNIYKYTSNIVKIICSFYSRFYHVDAQKSNEFFLTLFKCTYNNLQHNNIVRLFFTANPDIKLSLKETLDLFQFKLNNEIKDYDISRVVNIFPKENAELLTNYFYQNNKSFIRSDK